MTRPQQQYDGDGPDPWLPTRLAHNELIVAGERRVYDGWLSRFARWLGQVRRGMLAAYRVDPNVVWRYVPQWLQAVAELVHDTIGEIVGQAYRSVFGEDYRYDVRPYVVDYLSQVENRLVRTPDEVYDLVVGELAQGAMAGESVPALSARVARVLDASGTDRWTGRATVVARTETLAAYNASRTGAFMQVAADLEEPFEQVWLATADARTRPSHRAADLQRVPLGQQFLVGGARLRFPGDPSGPAQETIQCRCVTLIVKPGEGIDLSNRQFEHI